MENTTRLDIKRLETQSQAEKAMKEGKAYLNAWCCFKPDYLEASPRFKEAGEKFLLLGDYENSIKCYEKLAECDFKLDDLFGASEAHKTLGCIYLNHKGNPEKATIEFRECINLIKLHGKTDRVQTTLMEFAKKCNDQGYYELSESFYKEIIDSVFDNENYLNGVVAVWEFSEYLIGRSRFSDALNLYKKHIAYVANSGKYSSTLAKCYFCVFAVHIVLGEPYVGEEVLRELERDHPELMTSPYYEVASKLLDAIEQKDQGKYNKIVLTPIMSQIDRSLLMALKKVSVGEKPVEIKLEDVKIENAKPKRGLEKFISAESIIRGEVKKVEEEEIKAAPKIEAEGEEVVSEQKAKVDKEKADINEEKADINEEKADINEEKADANKEKADMSEEKAEIDPEKAGISEGKAEVDEQKAVIDEQKEEDYDKYGGIFK